MDRQGTSAEPCGNRTLTRRPWRRVMKFVPPRSRSTDRLARSVLATDYIATERARVEAKDFISPVRNMYASSMELSKRWADQFRSFWGLPSDFAF